MTDAEIVTMNEKFVSHPIVIEIVGQLLYCADSLDGLNILGIIMIDFKEDKRDEVTKLVDELISYVNQCSQGKIDWDAWETMPDNGTRSEYGGCTDLVNHFFGGCGDNPKEKLIRSISFSK